MSTTAEPFAASNWARQVAEQLTEVELSVLDVLEQQGAVDETQVASSARLAPSVTTDALSRLEQLGFVHRGPDALYALAVPVSGRQ
jgi:DNA-binding MarR family transcriptional regulator